MPFDLQPTHLANDWVQLHPLQEADFEALFAVASDPLIWAQHPSPNRYQRKVFEQFFEGALASGGAFLFRDALTGMPIGSSRFYDEASDGKSIYIGYSFFARQCWGLPFNFSAKTLMLDHALAQVDEVLFSVGALNIRSQKAMEKLGAQKFAEKEIAYYGEQNNLNFLYRIGAQAWTTHLRPLLPARRADPA